MTFHRREVLGTLGVASASTILWALGCGASAPTVRRAPQVSGEVRTWLHDAVARLAAAHPFAHALAVSRRRTIAARDVLGAGAARQRVEGVVLTIRDRTGAWREHVTSDLSRDGVDAAARALGAARLPRSLDFGRPPPTPDEPPHLDDRDLHHRVELLLSGDAALAPRLIYAAAAIDLDDAIVWSVAPGRDLEQRLVRIRQTALRAAWNGTRPIVREAERAWSGWLDDQPLTPDDLAAASAAALELLTPGSFEDGERSVLLDPSVAAILLDAAARNLPAIGTQLGSSLVTLLDDPTTPAAYGAFAFDDEGEPATAIVVLEAGRVAGRFTDRAAAAASAAAAAGATATTSADSTSPGPRPGATVGSRSSSPATSTGAAAGSPARSSSAAAGLLAPDPSSGTAGAAGSSSPSSSSASAGRGRRPGHLGPVAPSPSHLRLVAGTLPAHDLQGDGVLLEGGIRATIGPDGDRIRIACTRARELRGGSTTGRIHADVELVGSLTALLAAIDAVAAGPVNFAPHSAGEPTWRSIATPALRTRGFVRARRSRA